jgi:formylglycine-generating enzyme required for sulfatase activity
MTDNNPRAVIQAKTFSPSAANTRSTRISSWQTLTAIASIFTILLLGYLFTSKSVQLSFSPAASAVQISGGIALNLGDVYLLRQGDYKVTARTELHEQFNTQFTVTAAKNQRIAFAFTPLPGRLKFNLMPVDATIKLDGVSVENSDSPVQVKPGPNAIEISHPRYFSAQQNINIIGRGELQTLAIKLDPKWANIEINSNPINAEIWVDDINTGQATPAIVEILSGEHGINIRKAGYKTFGQRIFVQAGEPQKLNPVELTQADAQLSLTSNPSGAAAIVDGKFIGPTPIRLDLQSNANIEVSLIYAGHARANQSIFLEKGEVKDLHLNLEQLTGTVSIETQPEEVEVRINGKLIGRNDQTVDLPLTAQTIALTKSGYAAFETVIKPKAGLTQSLRVKLLSLEEARLAALKPIHTTHQQQRLRLFSADSVDMGASRREPGRRANETLRSAKFDRLFYLSEYEVTNEQFRAFIGGHDSGSYQDTKLNQNDHPVVMVGWSDAAAYCNWLSQKDQLAPFYTIELGKVIGVNSNALGYRLPSEAEWAWAARKLTENQENDGEQLRFAWGNTLPPPERFENYADRSAANLVGRTIFSYNDNYSGSAPVGTFPANHHQLFDIGGNVAEWTHDFYEIPKKDDVEDYLGPVKGEYHVIKGASWMHGTITELRLSFRDYGIEGRQDVGFRIARYAE